MARRRFTGGGSKAGGVDLSEVIRQLVPPGSIIDFGGPAAPVGYLACDGTLYNTADYPDLFAAIGYSWGGAGAQFRVPDLRAYVTRMVDGAANRDPDKASRSALYSGGQTGNNVGSYQGQATKRPNSNFTTDSMANHQHSVGGGGHEHLYTYTDWYDRTASGGGGAHTWDNSNFPHAVSTYGGGGHSHITDPAGTHGHSVTGGGDNETRPINAYVMKCIKV